MTTNRIKFTSKVKRGIVLARGLLIDSFDSDATPSDRQVRGWTRAQERDLNAALAWMEQVESDTTPAPAQEVFDTLAAAIGHRAENDPKAVAAC